MATIPEAHPVGAGELYSPIASWQTRILRLHSSSGGKNDVLRADLLVAGLLHDEGVVFGMDNEEPTTYEAISYSWGPDNATERIIVNGLRRHINPSLAGALRRFRLPEESRYLWADAICINQADNAEKSAQVRSMFTIFRKARRVLAWLGDEGTGGSQALASYEAKCNTLKGNPWANMRGVLLDEEDAYDDLATVALVPWPRRAWVQQEVFAAQELTLYYGKCEMSLDHYFGLLVGLCKSPIQRRLDELERQRKVLSSLCGLSRSDERLNLLELGRLLSAKREHSATFLEGAEFRLRKAEPAVQPLQSTTASQPKWTASIKTLTLHSHITLKTDEALSWDWTWSTKTHPTPDFELPRTGDTRLKVGDLFVQVQGWDLPVILREEEDAGPAKRFRLVDVVSDRDFLLRILGPQQHPLPELRPTHDESMVKLVGLTKRLVGCVPPGGKEDFVVC
ncbi:hypothetical protein B0A54_03476 [Friedmanniomyces endolithicus]|uniref:Heterokaryon incompatibility domain-containing protein n=1 Tax=Friedmanniomyces endolithicus TaxID=329885 RepID=A0A4U0VA56_9PEZI|nr:hypothetical protein B0A54_03476 [Friedmanniomyces endolithicus]